MLRRLAALHLAAVLLAPAACGERGPKPIDYGPYYGTNPGAFLDKAPANRKVEADELALKFVDSAGQPVDLTQYRGKKNVVLVVTRGIPQSPGGVFCPSCLAQVSSLLSHKLDFDRREAVVRVVFPGPATQVDEFVKQSKQRSSGKSDPEPFLLDRELAIVKKLGIEGDLAQPATYIADKKGNVVYAYVGKTAIDRPSVKAILAELERLK
jgi:peroxiredoxin